MNARSRTAARGARVSLPRLLQGTSNLVGSAARVAARRIVRGPRREGWSYRYEVAADLLREVALVHARAPRGHASLREIREVFHTVSTQAVLAARRTRRRTEHVAGVPGSWFVPRRSRIDRTILYVHGGGYSFGSSDTHAALLAELAHDAGAEIFAVDYALAPEHPFPRALDEVHAVYRAFLDAGRDPRRIVIAGDSAGGGMSVATALRARDAGDPLPAALVLLSPWVDLAAALPAAGELVDWIPPSLIQLFVEGYLRGVDPRHPHASPAHADLSGLPPMLVQAGGAEILREQIERFAERASRAGTEVTLEIAPHMVHVWQGFAPIVPESRAGVARLGRFVRDKLR